MDVEVIDAGVDFVKVLEEAVQSCDVLVALIGRNWLNIKDGDGKRRLKNPEDFVRIEVAAALSRDIRVIPVLVGGAPMPRSSELPENLKPLTRRNALTVNHGTFHADMNRLIEHLERALEAVEASKALKTKRTQEEQARKERQQERVENIKKSFSRMGKLPLFIGGGIILLFTLGYFISKIDFPATPERTQAPTKSNLATATFALPTSTSLPATIATPTKILSTPTSVLGVGSTMTGEDGMTLVYVPAGEFQMGSENGDSDEKPVHSVYLDAFWIDQTEVTNAMYAQCVEAGKCDPPSSTKSSTHESYYGNPEFDDYPVIYVSWNNAAAYCDWAGRRLPTEAEWEKAAGWDEDAQAQRVYPWGDTIDESYANYNNNIGDTTAVGSYEKGASFYDAYDMAGNVWEWVADWYDSNYYSNSPSSNPTGPDSGSSRVLRGGAWNPDRNNVRSASRYWYFPTSSFNHIGFRCSSSAAAP